MIPELTCPRCHSHMDVHRPVPEHSEFKPENGSINICMYCQAVSLFVVQPGEPIRLRVPTPQEMNEFKHDRETWKMILSSQQHCREYLAFKQKKLN